MNMQIPTKSHSQCGFTLIELLIVVVLTALIAAIAMPNYQAFIVSNRVKTNASMLYSAINEARLTANGKGPVTLCKSDNPDAAAPTCSAVTSDGATNVGWGSGWISFIDANNNGTYDAGDTLLKVQPPLLRSVAEGSIVPTPQTQSLTVTGAGNMFGVARSFYIKPPDNYVGSTYNRYLCISSSGRVAVVKALPC